MDTPHVEAPRTPRRAQLIAHAAELFGSHGYAGVSMQELAAPSGITAAAIYRHFTGKDELLDSILLETVELLVHSTAGLHQLGALLRAATDAVVGAPGMLATYVRERHRCTGALARTLACHETHLFGAWAAATAAEVTLPRSELLVRDHAITGVFASLSCHPSALASTRAKSLVVDALHAISVDGAVAPDDVTSGDERPWEPTPSRRREILTVAMRLFSERGYHGVGLNEVGSEAGVAGPSIYEHYDSKAAILLEAYDHAGAIVVASTVEAVSGAASAEHALRRLTRAYARACAMNVALLTVTAQEDSWVPTSERPRLARRRREIEATWTGVLAELRPELTAADALLLVRAALPMARHLARIDGGRVAPDHVAHLLHTFLVAPAAS